MASRRSHPTVFYPRVMIQSLSSSRLATFLRARLVEPLSLSSILLSLNSGRIQGCGVINKSWDPAVGRNPAPGAVFSITPGLDNHLHGGPKTNGPPRKDDFISLTLRFRLSAVFSSLGQVVVPRVLRVGTVFVHKSNFDSNGMKPQSFSQAELELRLGFV